MAVKLCYSNGCPRKLYIPPLLYDVGLLDEKDMGSAEGRCKMLLCQIEIRNNLPVDRIRSVLWHEILHAVWEVADLPHCWKNLPADVTISGFDEMIVEALSGRLLEVIRVNPALRDFLLRK